MHVIPAEDSALLRESLVRLPAGRCRTLLVNSDLRVWFVI